jgi:hypothetical protein
MTFPPIFLIEVSTAELVLVHFQIHVVGLTLFFLNSVQAESGCCRRLWQELWYHTLLSVLV